MKGAPSNAEVPLSRRSSVIMNTNSHTAGSLNSEDTLSKKHSYIFDQVDSNVKKVTFDENPAFSSETIISCKPTFSGSDCHLDSLEILKKSGAIQVIYPKQSSGNLVNPPASAVTSAKIKNTPFLDVFSQFAHKFSHENLENVSDLP